MGMIEKKPRHGRLIAHTGVLKGPQTRAQHRIIAYNPDGILPDAESAHMILLKIGKSVLQSVPGSHYGNDKNHSGQKRQEPGLLLQRPSPAGNRSEKKRGKNKCQDASPGKGGNQGRCQQQNKQEQQGIWRDVFTGHKPGYLQSQRGVRQSCDTWRPVKEQPQRQRYRHLHITGKIVVADVGSPYPVAVSQIHIHRIDPENPAVPGHLLDDGEDYQKTAHEENRLDQGFHLILGAVVADDDEEYGCMGKE